MERGVRPTSRRRTEGTKFDFRLHFQASRVPISGWDKLVVSLLSLETGRITVKTSRGFVRNGSCQWPDPVVESTNLFQNLSTGECNEKLYKLFVQMGSLRAGILGEATINLAEYVTAEFPESVSLPLRNCSAGTILHVKIQCLTPKAGIRDLEGQRISSLEQECPGSVSEDNSSSSDLSENPTSGSLGSSASKNVAALSYVPASQVHHRVEHPFTTASRPNSDVVDYSSEKSLSAEVPFFGLESNLPHRPYSTTGSNSYNSQESNKTFQPKYQARNLNFPNLYSLQTELLNSKLNPQGKDSGAWIAAGIPQKLEAAEATIQELREESLAWERQARKLAVEVETFKQKLAYESKMTSELKMKLSASDAECDGLKSEVEQLKALKLAPKMRGGSNDNFNRWEIEDSRRTAKVLQEELLYEKEINGDLQMQLCKTQDSNANLLSALAELEETLEASNKLVEKLTEANKKLEEFFLHGRRELETSPKLPGDAEVILINEETWKQNTSIMEAGIGEREDKIRWLESQVQELSSILQLSAKDEKEIDTRTQLEAEIVKLGAEVDKLALDIAARDTSIQILTRQLAKSEAEKVASDERIQTLWEERHAFSSNMDAEKASVLEKLEEAHTETSRKTQRLEELVEEMESLRSVLDSRASKNKVLESKRDELLAIQKGLEAQIFDLEERNVGLTAKYENEVSRLRTRQTLLEQELQEAKDTCAMMQDKLAALEIQLQDSANREHTLRLEIDSLLGCKKSLEQSTKIAEEAVIAAEKDKSTSMNLLKMRLEQLSLSADEKENVASHAMAKVAELQAEKMDLKNSLAMLEEKVKGLEQLPISLKALDIKLRDVLMEIDASKLSCNDLTQKLLEKESVLQEQLLYQEKQDQEFQKKVGLLEVELLEKATLLSELGTQIALCEGDNVSKETISGIDMKDVLQLQERLRSLEAEVETSKEQLFVCKKDFLQKETELMDKIEHLELSNEQLAAGLVDSGANQLQKELIRLQTQNSFLSRREQELLSQMHTQDVLQEEVKRLQEANDLLEARLSKLVETAKNPFLLEKIVSLETELAEAFEANNAYKLQLKSVLDKRQLGDLDQVVQDVFQYKKKAAQLQNDLDSMHERYTLISLKLAETEAERGELMITLKNLKGINKK